LQLPVHRRVREGVRRRGALERRRHRRRLAHRRAGAVGQGQQRAVPGRDPRGPPAGLHAMSRLLLVGGNGQLGRELRRSLAPLGEVVATTRDGRLYDGGQAIAADLDSPGRLAEVVREVAPDAVINAAAYTAVDKAESEPEAAFRTNGEAPGAVTWACAAAGIPLVNYSTDYVFDGSGTRPYREDDPTAPLGTYGA